MAGISFDSTSSDKCHYAASVGRWWLSHHLVSGTQPRASEDTGARVCVLCSYPTPETHLLCDHGTVTSPLLSHSLFICVRKVRIFSPYPMVAEVLRVCLNGLLWNEYCWSERLKGEVFHSNTPNCGTKMAFEQRLQSSPLQGAGG